VTGHWVEAPVDDFITTLEGHFDDLRLVAEDLGLITDDVKEVMKRYGFPGMKVLQFAFREDNPKHPYLPHNIGENSVVYTGTHDNNTVIGWYNQEASREDMKRLADYLGYDPNRDSLHWEFIELALRCRARMAITPMQDLPGLPETARMNVPATSNGNWTWRVTPQQLETAPIHKLAGLVRATYRI
jgi:4-alpha-glucanotransferase